MNNWYAIDVGPDFTLGLGSIQTPYDHYPYLVALGHPPGFPDGTPVVLTVLDQIRIASFSENICINGSIAYMSVGSADLAVIDVSDPTAMTIDHTMTLTGGCRDLLLDESRALLISAEWDSVRIYSTAQPGNPIVLSSLAASQSVALAQNGNLIYVACSSLGLRVLDTANPQLPVEIAHLPVGGTVRDIALWRDQALMVGPTVGLVSVDVSIPGAPLYLSTVPCEGEAEKISTRNGYAYIRSLYIRHPELGFNEEKLHLFRLFSVAPPHLEGSFFPRIESGAAAGALTIAGDNVLLATDDIIMANVQCAPVSNVRDLPGPRLTLGQPWPNPFNPMVELTYGLPSGHTGRLSVYDMRGRKVQTLWMGHGTGQDRKIQWSGTTEHGSNAPSGTYLFVLGDDRDGSRKIVRASLVK